MKRATTEITIFKEEAKAQEERSESSARQEKRTQ
jgi:hypothetical protein